MWVFLFRYYLGFCPSIISPRFPVSFPPSPAAVVPPFFYLQAYCHFSTPHAYNNNTLASPICTLQTSRIAAAPTLLRAHRPLLRVRKTTETVELGTAKKSQGYTYEYIICADRKLSLAPLYLAELSPRTKTAKTAVAVAAVTGDLNNVAFEQPS